MSPTLLSEGGFRFRFYTSDESEPPHIHAQGSSGRAKVWLQPVSLAYAHRLSAAEIRTVLRIVEKYESYFLKQWTEYWPKGGPDLGR